MEASEDILIRKWINEACKKNSIPQLGTEMRVMFSQSMTRCLGAAFPKQKLIKLSKPLWARASEEEKKQAVMHEACHVIVFQKWKANPASPMPLPHGREWKLAMALIGQAPERTHRINRNGLIRERRKAYEVRCKCTPSVWLNFNSKEVQAIKMGNVTCANCKHTVEFTG